MTESTIEATQSIMIYDDFVVLYDKKDGNWCNPRPLSQDDIKELIVEASTPYPLPPNMIWYEEYKMMIWHSKPCKRKISVRVNHDWVTKYYHHPGLLFKVKRLDRADQDNLHVTAVAPDFDPAYCLDQKVYHSPYASHDVEALTGRMGNCKVMCPNPEFAYDLEGSQWKIWPESFYASGFNHFPSKRNLLKPRNMSIIEWMEL